MITEQQYVILSLELNMFFGRIMKEHSLFLEAGFTTANPEFSKNTILYRYSHQSGDYEAGRGTLRRGQPLNNP